MSAPREIVWLLTARPLVSPGAASGVRRVKLTTVGMDLAGRDLHRAVVFEDLGDATVDGLGALHSNGAGSLPRLTGVRDVAVRDGLGETALSTAANLKN